jgi:dihydrofolate reductase
MKLSLIACMAKNRVIGRGSEIPWNVPGEQLIFRRVTSGHAVIMGRKTYESIGRPLPKRTNIVVTRQSDYDAPGCTVVSDLPSALEAVPDGEDEAFIMGGGQLYAESIGQADRVHLSELSENIEGDVLFPEVNASDFAVSSTEEFPDASIPYIYRVFDRR